MLDNFKNDIINQFNVVGDLLFQTTETIQQVYDNNILDEDGKPYIATIINEFEMPIVKDFFTTRTREFELVLKGHANLVDDVREIVNDSKRFKVNDNTYFLGNLNVEDVLTEDYGNGKISVFYATLRVSVEVPIYITGADVKVEINDKPVKVIQANDTHDKALLSSIGFGDNTSATNTGSEHIYTFVLESATSDLFKDVRNETYNKTYTFDFDFVVMTQKIDLVLRRGIINWGENNNAITFTCVFERALPRTTIKLNGYDVEAMGFTPQLAMETILLEQEGMNRLVDGTRTKVYNMQLVNDKSQVINDILDDYEYKLGSTFDLEYKINNRTITNKVKIINLLMSVGENPFAVFNVTFGEKVVRDGE